MSNAAASTSAAPDALALQRIYRWEREAPDRVVLTQPQGGGAVRDFTWRQVIDEARRMAAHLQSLGAPPGSRIALLSKNCAHWLIADFAIWMAGYVSVPLYPTLAAATIRQILEHSEAQLLFVGKLDGWAAMRARNSRAMPCIALPLAPANDFVRWGEVIASTPPLEGQPLRDGHELATIMYTSGTTGMAEGRDAQLRHVRLVAGDGAAADPARHRGAHAQLSAAGPRRRALARGARPARHRHACVLRGEPGHLHRRHAAGRQRTRGRGGPGPGRPARRPGHGLGGSLALNDHLRPIGSPTGQRSAGPGAPRFGPALLPPIGPDEAVALGSGAIDEELELRRRADRIACAKPETRAALLHRVLLAADFIASHHDEPISLAEMASAVSLSRFHFGRLFSLVHGQTPHAFLLNKRTAAARRHIAVGAACLDAATRAGFGSRSALFRNLRKSTHPTAAVLAGRVDPCSLSA